MSRRFAISFNRVNMALMTPLGMGPAQSYVDVDDDSIMVRLGIGFRAAIPRAAVSERGPFTGRVTGWGAHGWRGQWLVNGSSQGIVTLGFEPVQRAYVLGLAVRLARLSVSLDEPDEFMSNLARR